jgi:phosphoglycolate phosphatase-like HAD superfamily hydrolase
MGDALERELGLHLGDMDAAFAAVEPWGKTDRQIMRLLIERHRRGTTASDDELDRAAELACELHHTSERQMLTGEERDRTEEALGRLLDAGHRLALLTGNLEPIARRKMELSGLAQLFPPGQGGFGSDAEPRPALVPIARGRAGDGGSAYPREHTVLIGDTPLDVAAAQADGARCIGVSGKRFSADDLTAVGADAVVDSVPGVEQVLAGWS